ncbi:MAG TPA: ThuA domain-containing protein [Solirubrobacter sp.]|nr:ThuA domain-containing protein [Solirubrobacter sp.]
MIAVPSAWAQDTTPPQVQSAEFTTAPDGNNAWRLTSPQTLNLSATDDVAVAKFQYSVDNGATYVDVPVTPGPTATASVTFTLEGNTTLRYRAVDSAGNPSRGASANITLNQAAAAGATAIRLSSTNGRSAGDLLLIDTGDAQELATIESIVTPAPPSPQPNVTLTAPLANAHAANAAIVATATYSTIALRIDTRAPIATWATQATTLQAAATTGDTQVRLASLTGRAPGDLLQLDQGENAETVTIASIVDPPPAAPEPNVVLTSALQKSHLSGSAVYLPQIVDGKVMQSQTLTPLRTDPRLRDPSDTVTNGAGGAAPRRMTIDGEFMIPKPLALNQLTVGKHTQTVSLQDTAGNTAKYTNTFVVTTSFSDLATVIDQYADNALRTTLNGAQAVGAMGLRLQSPIGFRAGQELVVDTGDNQETVKIAKVLSPPTTVNTTLSAAASAGDTEVRIANYTQSSVSPPTVNGPVDGQPIVLDTGANQEVITIKRHITPLPPAPAPNVVLSAPLQKDHAAGTATNLNNVILESPLTKAHASGAAVANPRPFISAAKANELRTLLADAKAKADANDTAGAIAALESFKQAAAGEPALVSAGQALIAQLQGTPVDTSGTGVTVGPAEEGVQVLRTFYDPTVPVSIPGAQYKVLINGRAGGFRHQSIVDFEWMIQDLGAKNGFDVDIWDPAIGGSPGRYPAPGVSLPTSPFMDLETLKQYKTIVFNSTVGINATSTLNPTELANFQEYIRQGGGFVAIHGAIDSMQNVPWYMDLAGAGFTNHGSNQGGILIETESGGHVEFINADPAHTTTAAMPLRFYEVEEVYNTNRNPAEMGIVHPLVYENEDSLVNQLGYGTGSLHNSDQHSMVWCRNFDGGRSFSSTLGHNWTWANVTWFREMILNAIEWTGGREYANCVTFNEVQELLEEAVEDGDVNAAGEAALSAPLAAADAAYRSGDKAAAAEAAKQFVAQTKRVANCGCADGGAALLELQYKGVELENWMSGDGSAPPEPKFTEDVPATVGGDVPPTLSLSLGAPATFGNLIPGVAQTYTASTSANVISSAGDALLSVADPSATATGRLVNGSFSLASPVRARASSALGTGGAFADVGGSSNPTSLLTYSGPVANDNVTLAFEQQIGANDPLRTGSYSKTLTFTLSTTTP